MKAIFFLLLGATLNPSHLEKKLWSTPHLTSSEASTARETTYSTAEWPTPADASKVAQKATKEDTERPKPYADATKARAQIYTFARRPYLMEWLQSLREGRVAPTQEQEIILKDVIDRIMDESEDFRAQETH